MPIKLNKKKAELQVLLSYDEGIIARNDIDLADLPQNEHTANFASMVSEYQGVANQVDFEVVDRVGTYTLEGDVFGSVPWYYAYFGESAISTRALLDSLKNEAGPLAEAGQIDRVEFRVNSYGGEAVLLSEVSEAIKALPVETVAKVDSAAYSAGYWIASAADTIEIGKIAGVGSIGAYLVTYDYSKLFEANGIDAIKIASHELKGIGVPGTEVTEAQKASLQNRIDELGTIFARDVAYNRNMPLEHVNELATGESFFGETAIKAGLADRFLSEQAAPVSTTTNEPVASEVAEPQTEVTTMEDVKPGLQTKGKLMIATARAKGVHLSEGVDEVLSLCVELGDLSSLEDVIASASEVAAPAAPKTEAVALEPAAADNGGASRAPTNVVNKAFGLDTQTVDSLKGLHEIAPFTRTAKDPNGRKVDVTLPASANSIPGYYGSACLK